MYRKAFIRPVVLFFTWQCMAVPLQAQHTADSRKVTPVDQQRVREIATLLPETPRGFGDPVEVRKRWDSLYATGKFATLVREADSISRQPFPQLTEAIYKSFYGGKDSETSKRFIMKRRMLLSKMVWAECLTNKGTYLPAIIRAVQDVVQSPTWTFPAEDRDMTNWNGTRYTIGLSSSAYGSDMAQTLFLLNAKLPPALKQQIRQALQQRIFNPVLEAVNTGNANKEFTSLVNTGNHNAVELANILGAAFTVIEDRQQRAVFAAIAEKYSVNYFESFLNDGYCTEGIGYYSYGFTHYVFLRELFWQHTNGAIDLFTQPKVARMARFAPAMEIINGVYPAISDCEQYIKPWQQLMYYLDRWIQLGIKAYSTPSAHMEQPSLCYTMFFFPNAVSGTRGIQSAARPLPVRDYFNEAGVLTVRPAPRSGMDMGATFKGGNNAEQHNHNDIGSYTIVVGDEILTGDVGLATYTPQYFTKERYKLFKTAASYGHNVPLVNGVQQREGIASQAKILTTRFTDSADTFAMDIASAYPGAGLKALTRTFEYVRAGKRSPHIAINDSFAFETPGIFETALVTRYPWKKISETVLPAAAGHPAVYSTVIEIRGKETLQVQVLASQGKAVIAEEVIDEGPRPYTRIGIRMPALQQGSVRIVFKKANS